MWYLAGYSKNSVTQCVEQCKKILGLDFDDVPTVDSSIEDQLAEYVSLLNKIRDIDKEFPEQESEEETPKRDDAKEKISSPFFNLFKEESHDDDDDTMTKDETEDDSPDMEVADKLDHKHSSSVDVGKTNRLQRMFDWFTRRSLSREEEQNVVCKDTSNHIDHTKNPINQHKGKRKDSEASEDSEAEEILVKTVPVPFIPNAPRLYQPNINFLDLCNMNFEDPNMLFCLDECFKANPNIQGLLFQHNGVTDEMLKIMAKNNRNLRTVSFVSLTFYDLIDRAHLCMCVHVCGCVYIWGLGTSPLLIFMCL